MDSFFDKYNLLYGIITLVGLTFFPRVSMLLLTSISFSSMSPLFYFGWIFAPHLTVSILATHWYWNTDYHLVIISWIIAIGGENIEKKYAKNKGKNFSFKWNLYSSSDTTIYKYEDYIIQERLGRNYDKSKSKE